MWVSINDNKARWQHWEPHSLLFVEVCELFYSLTPKIWLLINSPSSCCTIAYSSVIRTFLLDQENILYLRSLSILITCLQDNVRILLGEVTCWSFLGVKGLMSPAYNQYREDVGEYGAYGLSSLAEKTWTSNHFQMLQQRQHILLNYFKTLECRCGLGLNTGSTMNSKLANQPSLRALSTCVVYYKKPL